MSTRPDPRIDLLPGAIRPVAEICGFDGVEKLIEVFGGMRLYVPRAGLAMAVASRCGTAVAEALSQCYGGDYVVLPLAHSLATARKHAAIRNDTRSARVIAREWKMSVNSIYRIRGTAPSPAPERRTGSRRAPDSRQIDLVDWLARKA